MQELRALGEEIKDEWIITSILNSLPDQFSHFHPAWELQAEIDKTLSKLIGRLQPEETRIKSRESQTVESALMSRGKGKPWKKNPNKASQSQSSKTNSNQSSNSSNSMKCYKCGKIGHKRTDCTGKPCQEYIDYCKKHYKCNKCQEVGHFAKDCPKNNGQGGKSFISVSLTTKETNKIQNDQESWYMYSGSTHHMKSNLKWMQNVKPLSKTILVKIGDATELEAVSSDDIHLSAYDGLTWYRIVLRRVLFVPNLSFNLFSVTSVLDNGYKQEAEANASKILENGKTVLIAERSGGLFRMKFSKNAEYSLSAVSIKIWHERLAHQNIGYVRDILKRNKIACIDDLCSPIV